MKKKYKSESWKWKSKHPFKGKARNYYISYSTDKGNQKADIAATINKAKKEKEYKNLITGFLKQRIELNKLALKMDEKHLEIIS